MSVCCKLAADLERLRHPSISLQRRDTLCVTFHILPSIVRDRRTLERVHNVFNISAGAGSAAAAAAADYWLEFSGGKRAEIKYILIRALHACSLKLIDQRLRD